MEIGVAPVAQTVAFAKGRDFDYGFAAGFGSKLTQLVGKGITGPQSTKLFQILGLACLNLAAAMPAFHQHFICVLFFTWRMAIVSFGEPRAILSRDFLILCFGVAS